MALDPVAQLLARIRAGGAWPPRSEASTWRKVRKWRAFADGDRDALARIADWRGRGRRYRLDDLGGRIREAWADHLFGEELEVAPAAPPPVDGESGDVVGDSPDAEVVDALVTVNDLTDLCRAAEADLVIPEGEAYWRGHVDPDVAEVPLLEFYSRLTVAPYFVGARLMAVALITELEGPGNGRAGRNAVFRHLEVHTEERVVHVLHRGTKSRLGWSVELDLHPETEELVAELDDVAGDYGRGALEWAHGLPMLMGRIINRRGRNPRLGKSEFETIQDQLLDLNEAATIGAENARLTAKRRVVVPSSSVQPTAPRPSDGLDLEDDGEGGLRRADGRPLVEPWYDLGEDVLVADPVNEELGRDSSSSFQVLEYSFDAEPLIAYKRDLVETALTRIGLAPEWVGINTGNQAAGALSGTARRLVLMPTTKAAHGKAKPWDRELPRILGLLLELGNLPVGDGGLDLAVADPSPPAVERAEPIPEDPVEEATVESTLVSAGVRSIETSVRAQHPKWDDGQVKDEVDRIREDRKATGGGGLLGGLGGGA